MSQVPKSSNIKRLMANPVIRSCTLIGARVPSRIAPTAPLGSMDTIIESATSQRPDRDRCLPEYLSRLPYQAAVLLVLDIRLTE